LSESALAGKKAGGTGCAGRTGQPNLEQLAA
jgi:hypothetical protein